MHEAALPLTFLWVYLNNLQMKWSRTVDKNASRLFAIVICLECIMHIKLQMSECSCKCVNRIWPGNKKLRLCCVSRMFDFNGVNLASTQYIQQIFDTRLRIGDCLFIRCHKLARFYSTTATIRDENIAVFFVFCSFTFINWTLIIVLFANNCRVMRTRLPLAHMNYCFS